MPRDLGYSERAMPYREEDDAWKFVARCGLDCGLGKLSTILEM